MRFCIADWLAACVRVRVQIRGLSVNDAIAQMAFSPKNRGGVARHVIERAVANADFYHGWSRDELCIAEAFVGKNAQYPRVRYHSRGVSTPLSRRRRP